MELHVGATSSHLERAGASGLAPVRERVNGHLSEDMGHVIAKQENTRDQDTRLVALKTSDEQCVF